MLCCIDELAEVNAAIAAVVNWATERDDIRAMGMLGSWVRGNPHLASGLDPVLRSDLAPDYQRRGTWLAEIDFQNAGFPLAPTAFTSPRSRVACRGGKGWGLLPVRQHYQ
jgi:hypothetical protein